MERQLEVEKVIKPSRIGSYLLILFAAMLFLVAGIITGQFINAKIKQQNLEKKKAELIAEIERLNDLYNNLQDEDYYNLYVKEYYYENGEVIYK